jgi:hypothetical protein
MQHAAPVAPAVSSEAVRTWAGFTAKRTNAEKAAADAASGVGAGGGMAGMPGGLRGPDDGTGGSAASTAADNPAAGVAEAPPVGSDDEDFDSLLARLTGSAATQGGYCMPPECNYAKPIARCKPRDTQLLVHSQTLSLKPCFCLGDGCMSCVIACTRLYKTC